MSQNFFANTEETETFYLVEPNDQDKRGFFVKVKTRLSYGERRRLELASVKNFSPSQLRAGANGQKIDGVEQEEVGGTMTYGLDLTVSSFLKLASYIVEWNLTAADGSTVRLPRQLDERARLMERLDADTGDKISNFIDGMVEQKVKALEAAVAKDENGDAMDGTVLSGTSRVIRGGDDEENPTTPTPAGLRPSTGSRRA